jgi:hypothetical protein
MKELKGHEICGCKGCDLPSLAMGMCNKHWRRNKLYGSPFATVKHVFLGMSMEERFNARTNKGDGDSCWLWAGSTDQDGYGIFHSSLDGRKYQKAHQYSWAFHNKQQISKGLVVRHSCDTPGCVNPRHLSLGTVADNHADMDRRGRRFNARGSAHTTAILNESQVAEILIDPRPHTAIAQQYGVAPNTISSIKNRVSWQHVEVDHIAKNKRGSGAGNKGKSKLGVTPEIVREIRASNETGRALAERFGISAQLVGAIKKRTRWAHVE